MMWKKRLAEMNIGIEITDKVKQYLLDHGTDTAYGARPLKRAVQRYLEDPLSEELLNKTVQANQIVSVDYDKAKDKLTFAVKPKETQKAPEAVK